MATWLTTPVTRWLAAVTGYANGQIFEAAPNAKKPSGNYISWTVLSDMPGPDAMSTRTQDGDWVVSTRTRDHAVTLDINVFAADGLLVFEQLAEAAHNGTARRLLSASGLVFIRLDAVRNLQFLDGPNYGPRWQGEVTLRTMRDVVSRVEVVDEILISGEIQES